MKRRKKITITSLVSVVMLGTGILTFVEKSLDIVARATASEVPDSVQVNVNPKRTMAGEVEDKTEVIMSKGAK